MDAENGSVDDAFVSRYLRHDGETVEQAKTRVRREQEAHEAAQTRQTSRAAAKRRSISHLQQK